MGRQLHNMKTGATRKGKTLSSIADSKAAPEDAELDLDPQKDSLASGLLTHLDGKILFARLSDIKHAIPFDLIDPSTHPDPEMRALENQLVAENFSKIFLLSQDAAWLTGQTITADGGLLLGGCV